MSVVQGVERMGIGGLGEVGHVLGELVERSWMDRRESRDAAVDVQT